MFGCVPLQVIQLMEEERGRAHMGFAMLAMAMTHETHVERRVIILHFLYRSNRALPAGIGWLKSAFGAALEPVRLTLNLSTQLIYARGLHMTASDVVPCQLRIVAVQVGGKAPAACYLQRGAIFLVATSCRHSGTIVSQRTWANPHNVSPHSASGGNAELTSCACFGELTRLGCFFFSLGVTSDNSR